MLGMIEFVVKMRLTAPHSRRRGRDEQLRLTRVLAGGAELLPDEGGRIHLQNLYASVREKHSISREYSENGAISIVEIPLE